MYKIHIIVNKTFQIYIQVVESKNVVEVLFFRVTILRVQFIQHV